jgi:hypothetical protein
MGWKSGRGGAAGGISTARQDVDSAQPGQVEEQHPYQARRLVVLLETDGPAERITELVDRATRTTAST